MNERALSPRSRHGGPSRRFGPLRLLARSERGTAIVEFALIAPLLFAIVFMIIDFGRALNYYNNLTQLAGQGARAAVVNRNPDGTGIGAGSSCATLKSIQCQIATIYPSDTELQNRISVCLGTLDTATNSISTTTSPQVGQPVTVRTAYKFHFLPFLTSFFGFGTYTLTATQTERLEATPTWQEGSVSGPSSEVDACAKP